MNLPEGASYSTCLGDTPTLILKTSHSTTTIALHGATVLSFVPAGQQDLLWLSPKATAVLGKSIRGGIPLCGPWFGPHPTNPAGPLGGLMRYRTWTLRSVEQLEDGRLSAQFYLELPPDRELGWVHSASATFSIQVGESLQMELSIRNVGQTPFMLAGALHSYFAVSDVRSISIDGLGDRTYVNHTEGGIYGRQDSGPVTFNAEMARFFLTNSPVRLLDTAWNRVIHLRGWGHGATVVWNPWEKTGGSLVDVGEHWPEFVCIEHANVADTAIALPPAMSHHLGAEIQWQSMENVDTDRLAV